MAELHAIKGGNGKVDEIMVGDVKYIRADLVDKEANTGIDVEKLGYSIAKGFMIALEQNPQMLGVGRLPSSEPNVTPGGLDKLPDEKKGNELSAILFDKLPSNKKHGSRFRTFYTDFERDTGIGLFDFHKQRIESLGEVDTRKYPNRKVDSIFMIADEETIFNYAKNYEFKFNN